MDGYEATKIVFQRIQNLDPENASKIMGVLLIQDHGEKEMIRLAFGPEALFHSVILKAKKELGLAPSTPSTPPSPSPFNNNPLSLSRQNSCSSASSRILGGLNLPSPLSITNHSSSWTNSSNFSDDFISPSTYNGTSPSTMNSAAAPFYAGGGVEVDLIDELQLQDQLSFLNDGSPPLGPKSPDLYYPQQQDLASSPSGNDAVLLSSYNWDGGSAAVNHRRSCSVSDICMGSDEMSGVFGWKPCLYYARGYCKNGTSCRFLHGEGTAADGGVMVGSPNKFELMEQCQELIRSKASQQQRLAAASQLMASSGFPYASVPPSKCMDFLLQQQILADSPRSLMMGDGMHKFSRNRFEKGDFGLNGTNPGSRQIYLTFPADSTFKEEDVSNYFSIFGPVQDVRIPYQQKRMFGFVTFDYPETVKLILAKGNPHFVCDARVLVKPYKEKGKILDKHSSCRRQHQQIERGEFTGCGSPTGIESRDPYDLQLGARIMCKTQDMLWRRKLEEQADLQQAIDIQNRRLMGLQLLDVKRSNHLRALSTGAVISSPTYAPTFYNQNKGVLSGNPISPEAKEENGSLGTLSNPANVAVDPNANVMEKDGKDSSVKINGNGYAKESSQKEGGDFQESLEHNLPDSPFASPKAIGDYRTAFSEDAETEGVIQAPSSTNNNLITGSSLYPATSSATFKSCYFQVPRFASGHETIGM